MDKDSWRSVYIYCEEYEEKIKKYIDDKVALGVQLTVSDFTPIDVIRPTNNELLSDFLSRYNNTVPLKILDIGCGLGGASRYLASLGHSLIGCDVLPHFIELGRRINSLVNLSGNVTLQNKGIYDVEVEPSSFDIVILLGVLMNIPGQEPILKLPSYLNSTGLIYIEDYFLEKETELDEREAGALNGFHKVPFRKRSEYIESFRVAGLEVVEIIDMSKKCSEFAWARGERILRSAKEGKPVLDREIDTYGVNCPQILAHLEDFTEDELIIKFPNVCERIGIHIVYSSDRLLRWVAWVLKKSIN